MPVSIYSLILSFLIGFLPPQSSLVQTPKPEQQLDTIQQLEEEIIQNLLEDQKNGTHWYDWFIKGLITLEALGVYFLIYFIKTGGLQDFITKSFARLRTNEEIFDGINRRTSQILNYMGFRTLYLKDASLKTFREFLERNHLLLIYKHQDKEDRFFFISEMKNNFLKTFVLNGDLKEELRKNPNQNPLELYQRVPISHFLEEKGSEEVISFIVFLNQQEEDFLCNPLLYQLFPELNSYLNQCKNCEIFQVPLDEIVDQKQKNIKQQHMNEIEENFWNEDHFE